MPNRMRHRYLIVEMIDLLTITIEPVISHANEDKQRHADRPKREGGVSPSAALVINVDTERLPNADAEPNHKIPGGENL